MKKITVLLLALAAAVAQAEVYKSINADGEVVYSDTRSKGSEVMNMPDLPTYSPPPVIPSSASPSEEAAVETEVYQDLVFLKPVDGSTVRDNQGVINAELKLTPALHNKLKHRVQFFLDGEAYGKPGYSLRSTMNNVDRGEHTLTASVLDANGDTLISAAPVIVYLHRMTIYNPNHPNNPNRPKATPAPSAK